MPCVFSVDVNPWHDNLLLKKVSFKVVLNQEAFLLELECVELI